MTGQRQELVTFAVTDRLGAPQGTLTPDEAGTVNCTGGRRVWRGLDLAPYDWEALDPYDTLITPTWTVGTTATSCGVFTPVSGTATYAVGLQQPHGEGAEKATLDLQDQSAFLDVPLLEPVGLAVGASPTPAIIAILEAYGFATYDVAFLPASQSEPAVYSGTALNAIDSMCEAAGAYPLYFTAAGIPTVQLVPAPADMTADHVYAPGDGLVMGTPDRPKDFFSPNRWEAQGGTDDAPQTGVYNLASGVTGWQGQRQFVILDRFDVRGVSDQTVLDAAAQAAAVTAFRDANSLSFDTTTVPTHEAWDVIDYDGVLYLETAFTLPLTPGSVQTHTCGAVLTP